MLENQRQCKQLFVNLASEIMAAWTVVVAQLAEWSLPTAEVCGSNRVIGIFYISC